MPGKLLAVIVWLMVVLPAGLRAQELVPNGGFETYRNCPRQDNLLEEAIPWFNPNRATPDFYNYCFDTGQMETAPHTGRGMGKLFLDQGFAEYMATPLRQPLKAGECYYFEMWISTRYLGQYIPGTLGAYFSAQPATSTAKDMLNVNPQILDASTKTVSQRFRWETIRGTIKASGGEKYLTIGSFKQLPVTLAFYEVFVDDISLVPIQLNLGPDTTLCGRKSTYRLNATTPGATEYRWQDGSVLPTFVVQKPGKYWVTVTTPCKILRDTITVDYALDFSLGADTTLCNGQTLTLNAPADAPNARWQDGSGQRSYVVRQTGSYSLRVTQANCVAADTVQVNFIKPPQLELGPDKSLCGAQSYTLSPSFSEGKFAWQDAFAQPERVVNTSGVYRATVRNDCAVVSDSVSIDYEGCECVIYAPDAFTPNADGQNDLFRPFGCGDILVQSLTIFDRWGEVIFRTSTEPFQWDGFYKGSICPAGVYSWHIDYLLRRRDKLSRKQLNGSLLLLY